MRAHEARELWRRTMDEELKEIYECIREAAKMGRTDIHISNNDITDRQCDRLEELEFIVEQTNEFTYIFW